MSLDGNDPCGAARPASSGAVFHHGTSLASALSLLNGAPLSVQAAAQCKIDGTPGFYLSTDPVAAEFFAARRAPGVIVRYAMTAAAVQDLLAGGAMPGPVPQGNFPTPFPGAQLLIPPALFALFNRLRESGAIAVFPYRGQQE